MMDSMKTVTMAFSVILIVIFASGCISGDMAGVSHGEREVCSNGACFSQDEVSDGGELGEVCFNGTCFQAEIADEYEEMKKGLMNRESMDQGKGMLFIFEKEGVYPFWMKNTSIPLDIIWMDGDGQVVFISRDTQPCESDTCPDTNPGRKAKYVLEINAGISERIRLEVGDVFEFRL